MALRTQALFRDDAYLAEADAEIVHVNERGGVILARTVFYATSGGQPGDTGKMTHADGRAVDIAANVTGETKEDVTARLMELVRADHPVFTRWITDDELAANPSLVKSKNVRPPAGTGRIRLVGIGEGGAVDSQPCGGTHVASTAEVGEIHIGKIEKKGRENRRFRIRFGPMPVG